MFSGLDPNTKYRVEIFINGTNSSTSSPMKLRTFGQCYILCTQDACHIFQCSFILYSFYIERVIVSQVSLYNNTANLTCKYNNSKKAIYSDPPQISWKRNGIDVTGEVIIINTEPLQTVNMAVEDGDNVSCSIHLITGGVEESDLNQKLCFQTLKESKDVSFKRLIGCL